MGRENTALARTETLDMATAGADDDTEVQVIDASAIAALNQSEIEQQVATAHRYPRSVARFREDLLEMATLDQATADSCIYALPRGGKTIEGPSVRFAEMVASTWGNLRWGAFVVAANDDFVVARGFAHDLQGNSAIAIEVRRRVQKPTRWKDADDYKRKIADMKDLACAAATSIARRNALFSTVPRALCQEAYDAADQCATTGKGSFEELRERAIGAFVGKGAKPEQVFAALGVEGPADITGKHLRLMRRLFTAVKDGASLDEVLRPAADVEVENRGRGTVTTSDLAAQVTKPQKGSTPKRERQPGEDDEDPTDKNAP
jgi:hypothetical protein